jgi:hypothetical protein
MNGGQGQPLATPGDARRPSAGTRYPFGKASRQGSNPFYLTPEWRALVAEIIR